MATSGGTCCRHMPKSATVSKFYGCVSPVNTYRRRPHMTYPNIMDIHSGYGKNNNVFLDLKKFILLIKS